MPANYVLLERIELNASAASVTFSNIPQTGYTDLKVVISANCTTADDVRIRFNGNTSASYSMRSINGSGSAVSSASESGQTSSWCGNFGGAGSIHNNAEIYIPNYLSTSNAKSTSVDNVSEANSASTPMRLIAQLWNPSSQAAISSILLYPSTHSWSSNSTFSLYGLAATGTTPTIAPKASGGNVIATDGTYWYHAFNSSGTFTPQVGLSCDALVIAGGGGGQGGGGGAGGLAYTSSNSLTAQGYTVTIGAGGANLVSGSNSQFGALTAAVGGGGASSWGDVGQNGGSGGGGASTSGTTVAGGTATSGQGNAGGSGVSNGGGGGGGAGAVGSNGNGTGGAGGVGSSAYSSWGLATNTGQNVSSTYYYAGGGGGGSTTTGGTGGSGGGGNGSYASPTAATINTGGGGGGAYNSAGQPGGSGIVIIRYAIA
jgi:hypothetical protein